MDTVSLTITSLPFPLTKACFSRRTDGQLPAWLLPRLCPPPIHTLSLVYLDPCSHSIAAFRKCDKLISTRHTSHQPTWALYLLSPRPGALLSVHGWLPSFSEPPALMSSEDAFTVHMTYGKNMYLLLLMIQCPSVASSRPHLAPVL